MKYTILTVLTLLSSVAFAQVPAVGNHKLGFMRSDQLFDYTIFNVTKADTKYSIINIDKPVAYPYLNVNNKNMSSVMKNVAGHMFGQLEAISFSRRLNRTTYWNCRCSCGQLKEIRYSDMAMGKTKSCGCLNIQKIKQRFSKHKDTKSKEYRAWRQIKTRCYNKNTADYAFYGGKGIKMCDRWLNSYDDFLSDVGRSPSPKHTIDRENGKGNYEPNNCRWATREQQSNNLSSNISLSHNGKVYPSLKLMCRELGLKYTTIYCRIFIYKWTLDRALQGTTNS